MQKTGPDMNRKSALVRSARLVQKTPLSLMRVLEAPLLHVLKKQEHNCQLIILLALPRSGSTLTYQALVHALQPAYLTNVWNMFYALPLTAGALSSWVCRGYQSDFQSEQGFIGGPCGPAEGLRFWSYWLGNGLDEHRQPNLCQRRLEKRIRYVRNVLGLVSTPEKPFLTGFVGHALVVDQLFSLFPNALFIRLHRDPLSNAYSLLRLRKNEGGQWFSVYPRECAEYIGCSLHQQVAAQVYFLNKRLDEKIIKERTLHISYEALCRDPNKTMNNVITSFNRYDMSLSFMRRLPEKFSYKSINVHHNDDSRQLAQALNDFNLSFGKLSNQSKEAFTSE